MDNSSLLGFILFCVGTSHLSNAVYQLLAAQHFLYFFPLPQGQASLRLIFAEIAGLGGFKAFSKSEISSGLSGSKPMI
ncbi:hypothetical protein CRENPOLYSF1_530031 [Crenothrix polyspora]|uniref:Uncharacterized protein n=1 Tax=Crenothrix polyspora TaxID=360316 RepID=A0A1R4HDQ7_9GAMM|nr:hypothetical protein CRENPOLYSF1_530031 [Crenothrix polyspora]